MISAMFQDGGRIWRSGFWFCLTACAVIALLPGAPRLLTGGAADKFEHALAFAVLAGLAGLAFPRVSGWLLWLALALFGAAIEIAQTIPVLHRDSGFDDWLVDAVVAAAVLAVPALRPRSMPALRER